MNEGLTMPRRPVPPEISQLRAALRHAVMLDVDLRRQRARHTTTSTTEMRSEMLQMKQRAVVERARAACDAAHIRIPRDTVTLGKRITRGVRGGTWADVIGDAAFDPEADGSRGAWI
jgi:hypothetical protein